MDISVEQDYRTSVYSKLNSNPVGSKIDLSHKINVSHDDDSATHNDNAKIQDYSAPKTLSPIPISFILSLFTLISIIIAVLVVCLTSPKPNNKCNAFFNRTTDRSIGYDSQPRSLAVADFNQDNKLDIVVTNSGQGSIGIFFGDGNGNISSQATYSTGLQSQPHSVVVAHFNQDHFLDIAVANYGTLNIGIFIGRQNGTFENQTTFSTDNSRPIFIAAGDFNNDTQQDIVVVNYGTNDFTIYVGHGNCTFTNQISYSTGYDSVPYSLAVADFNNDKQLDIVVADYGTDDITIFLGYGNGNFAKHIRYTTTSGSYPHSLAVADFDHDDYLDIVVANQGLKNIGIFYGYGNGSFTSQITYFLGIKEGPDYLTTGDINQDNNTDILIINTINSQVYVLPGNGTRSFLNLTTFIAEDGTLPYAAALGDFNNDTQLDAVIINYGTSDLAILTGYYLRFSATVTEVSLGPNSRPSSIAVGNFNNDQFLDMVVAKITTDSISILLGYGNGSFGTELSYSLPSGSAPQCIRSGDFNNDNRTDIVVANYGSHTVSVLYGDGNGSFSSMITYSTGYESFPTFLVVSDFNNDHALDIVVVNYRIDNIAAFLGYGNGSFSKLVTYSTGKGSNPSAITIADFNNDTHWDLAVANNENSNVGIFFGNGDGTFRIVITYPTGYLTRPDSIIVGDFNNDHWLDIVIADSLSDYVAILLGYANGTFGQAVMYTDASFSNPTGLAIVDINDDNNLDLLITNFGTNNIGVLAGYGNGSFYLGTTYPFPAGSGPKSIVLADFKNNTRWDILFAASGIGSVIQLIRYNEAKSTTQAIYSTGSGQHPHGVTIADFNNDNHIDIAVANQGTDDIGILLGHGNGSFTTQKNYFIGLHSRPQYLTVGDFNRDSKIDIVTTIPSTDSITLLLGNGNGSFSDPKVYSIKDRSQPNWVTTGDFNNDQRIDLVVANQGRDNIGIMLSYDYNTFMPQQTYSNQNTTRPTSIIAYDLNNDTYMDIAASFAGSDTVGILFGNSNGTFSDFVMYPVGYHSYSSEIIVIDVNNDNIVDLIITNAASSSLGVLLGRGYKTFAPVMTFSTGPNSRPYGCAAGDFNRDNHMDIVVANYYNDSMGIFLGYGNGSFATVVLYSTDDGSRPQMVAVSDFNQDNIFDIVVANFRLDNVGLFLGNGDGTFQNQIKFSTGYRAMPTFIIVNDFNNDQKMDVAVSNKNNDNIGVLYGYGNGSFAPVRTYSIGDGSSPQCLRSGDFNNDKIIDIAVNSPGTNYLVILYGLGDGEFLLGPFFSTGTKSCPFSLAIGDFNNDGKLDITTANYLMNNVGVHISYGIGSFGGISTVSTGPGSRPYSVAVSDFNNDGESDVVVANYGTNEIGILLGYGDGTFSNIVTYSMGDNARPIAVTVGELNQDNRTDIIVVNSESNNICILLGDGTGNFSIFLNYSTGYLSRPYAVSTADLNNDHLLDIIVVTAGTSSVLIGYGYGNGTFGGDISYELGYSYYPYGVAVADFDEDSWIDIAIANYGVDFVEVLIQSCYNI